METLLTLWADREQYGSHAGKWFVCCEFAYPASDTFMPRSEVVSVQCGAEGRFDTFALEERIAREQNGGSVYYDTELAALAAIRRFILSQD